MAAERIFRHQAIALVSALSMAVPADAQQPTYNEAIQNAKELMINGQASKARSLLLDLDKEQRASDEIDFLLGLLAIKSRDYDEAIGRFRTMLVRHPNALRVRLELARAFYLKRDYDNAFRQFQFARAGRLPPGVGATIDRYLAAVRQQKNWSYNLSISLAPDTNINNGTSAREVLLFGLPFELSDNSRRRSGVGLAIEAGAEFAPRITSRARLRLGGAAQRREYRGHDFDDTIMAIYAGPRIVLAKWDLSAVATGFQRRLGKRRMSEGIGTKVDATYYTDSRTALSLSLTAQQLHYPSYPLQTGPAFSASAGVVRALTPSSSFNARVGLHRKSARADDLSSWSQSVSAGYYRDLPGGFTIYVEPAFTRSRYDEIDPFFGKRRKDDLIELRVAALHRRIVVKGFTPRISLSWTRRNSSIDLYDLTQRRLEIGFTSSF